MVVLGNAFQKKTQKTPKLTRIFLAKKEPLQLVVAAGLIVLIVTSASASIRFAARLTLLTNANNKAKVSPTNIAPSKARS